MTPSTTLHSVWDVGGGIRVHGRVNERALGGDGGVPHVVFVHGLGMATDYLEPSMRALGERFAVSGLDLPGFGRSRRTVPVEEHSKRRLTLSELADALVEWMRVRRIVAPIVVGQSHGCQIVVE